MKTNLVIVLFLLATASFAQPTIYRVNADVTVTGVNVHHTLQAAHDAAISGDILIVEPGVSVGNLNCLKTLTIYGRGYYLDKNPAFSNLPDKSINSNVGTLDIYANNCKISGVSAANIIIHGSVSGTTISRSLLTNIFLTAAAAASIDNTTITQNYLNYVYLQSAATGHINNVTISNNLFAGVSIDNATISTNYYSSILINQNTMSNIPAAAGNAVISNNIFYGVSQASAVPSTNITNSTYSYNVTLGTTTIDPGLGANNTVISNPIGQFNSNTGGSSDNDYRVANGSLMKTANNLGGEVGMFGGDTPYIQYGIPAAPSVVKFFNTGIGNTDTPVTATVSGKSNN